MSAMEKPYVQINLYKNDISLIQIGGSFYEKNLLLDMFGYKDGVCDKEAIENAWKMFLDGPNSEGCIVSEDKITKDMGEFDLSLSKEDIDKEFKVNPKLSKDLSSLMSEIAESIIESDDLEKQLKIIHLMEGVEKGDEGITREFMNTLKDLVGEDKTLRLISYMLSNKIYNNNDSSIPKEMKEHPEEAEKAGNKVSDLFEEGFKQFEKDNGFTIDEDVKQFIYTIINRLVKGDDIHTIMNENLDVMIKMATLPYADKLIKFAMDIVDNNKK